jgi:hypothetical protein
MIAKLDSIPNFISAESPQGLRRAMLKNNLQRGLWHQYFDIKQVELNGKTVWVAWYLEKDADEKEIFKDE